MKEQNYTLVTTAAQLILFLLILLPLSPFRLVGGESIYPRLYRLFTDLSCIGHV